MKLMSERREVFTPEVVFPCYIKKNKQASKKPIVICQQEERKNLAISSDVIKSLSMNSLKLQFKTKKKKKKSI